MEQFLYERPREKLRNSGVSSLTLAELLQLILGSGTAGVSGAQLARGVEELLLEGSLSFDALIALPGMGEAKACQVVGLIEIARRLYGTDE